MYSREDVLTFKNFIQKIIEKPTPIYAQKNWSAGGKIFCEEWEMIELLKCLFYGEALYRGDPPPNRLKNNPLFDQDDIVRKAAALIEEFKTAEAIVEHLKKRREAFCGT